jgi:aminoglycoside phosphotransferase (APT) family kinase protein
MARLTVDLKPEQVRRIVRELDAALEPAGHVRVPGGNTAVYRIDLAGRKEALALKVYGDEPSWIVAKEALVAAWIGEEARVLIPKWRHADERRLHLPCRFALMTWLPGATMRSLIGTPGIELGYRQMGALLRRLHAIPMTAYGYIGGAGILAPQAANANSMQVAFAAAFRHFREQGADEDLAQRLEQHVRVRAHVLAASAGPVLCHDDFQQGNVLVVRGEDGRVELTGLIDFGNAQARDPLFDLAKALLCCTHEDPASRDPLLAGYGPLSHPAAAEALWVYTLFHRLVMWTHLVRHGADRSSAGPAGLMSDLDDMSRLPRES